MNRIIYKNQDNSIAILIPSEKVLLTVGIKAIAEKDVPAPYQYEAEWEIRTDEDGEEYLHPIRYETYHTPYWIVDASQIPPDRTFRDAWEVDESLGDPDGFGGTSNEFTDEQLTQLYKEGVI